MKTLLLLLVSLLLASGHMSLNPGAKEALTKFAKSTLNNAKEFFGNLSQDEEASNNSTSDL